MPKLALWINHGLLSTSNLRVFEIILSRSLCLNFTVLNYCLFKLTPLNWKVCFKLDNKISLSHYYMKSLTIAEFFKISKTKGEKKLLILCSEIFLYLIINIYFYFISSSKWISFLQNKNLCWCGETLSRCWKSLWRHSVIEATQKGEEFLPVKPAEVRKLQLNMLMLVHGVFSNIVFLINVYSNISNYFLKKCLHVILYVMSLWALHGY